MSKKFETLQAWQSAKEMVLLVYDATDKYPRKEQFGITSQTNRAAVSVPSNIAEGSSRSSKKDYCHFLEISIGSAFELENLLVIAFERKYLVLEDKAIIENKLEETLRLTYGLKRSMQ